MANRAWIPQVVPGTAFAALKLPAGISDNGPTGIPRRKGLAVRAERSGATLASKG